jgi:hypothetical protein
MYHDGQPEAVSRAGGLPGRTRIPRPAPFDLEIGMTPRSYRPHRRDGLRGSRAACTRRPIAALAQAEPAR